MAALTPPITPMLARLTRELPQDGFVYEPKWDGFRCLAFRDGAAVDLRSRNGRPLARYFPEVVGVLRSLDEDRFVVDGELVVIRDGIFDFAALMARLHPAASRAELLSRETPAVFIAFDVLALGDDTVMDRPFAERRTMLQALVDGPHAGLAITPATPDAATARGWLERFSGGGIDGVVAKHRDGRYEPGRRAMVKVKLERTADCVIAGFRWSGEAPRVTSLLLGLYDDDDVLRHVGVVGGFTHAFATSLLEALARVVVPLDEHPWREGFALEGGAMGRLKGAAGRWTPDMEMDWAPVAPELVCEVAYDQVDGWRFRHPARWRRLRPDRDAASCRLEQVVEPPAPVGAMLGDSGGRGGGAVRRPG